MQRITRAEKRFCCLAIAGAVAAGTAWGQAGAASAQGAAVKSPAFEVISVRRSKPDCSMMILSPAHGRYSAHCVTLFALIYNAYDVRSGHGYPPGLPGWGDKDKFDIEAKADDETTAAMEKPTEPGQEGLGRWMLQSLLADRFQLRVHYESKVQPIYELVVAKGGFKLKPLPPEQKSGPMSGGPGVLKIHGHSIAQFAGFLSLSNLAGRPVVDRTGIAGNYEIDLRWTPDDKQGTPDAGPTLVTAIQEQLGLKLEPAKGPVDTLVIDHAEQPPEN